MRVVISGPRDLYVSHDEIAQALMAMEIDPNDIECIINGGHKKGIDYCTRNFADANGIPKITEYALWDEYGKAAGPWRNMKMAQLEPDAWLAFARKGVPITSGTASGIAEAYGAGIYLYIREA